MNSIQPSRRSFLAGTIAGAAGLATLPTWAKTIGANDDVRVAVIGFNGRGAGHIGSLLGIKGVRLVALCDVDDKVMEKKVADLAKKNITVKQYKDYRKLLADPEIDAVTIATPNHSHTLIAMSAIAAGKHVYVEKPVCHNISEGNKLVAAAAIVAKKGMIVQHGMQRRSSPGWAEAMEYIKSGEIGKVTLSRGINFKARQSIGKVDKATEPTADGRIAGTFRDTGGKPQIVDVDYTLWSAPRPVMPMQREQFHYDWHWQWAYGNGDIGNQGPHQLDVARWALGNPAFPKRVMSLGGRWGYKDDGQTANNQMAFFQYAKGAPILFDNRGLPMKDMNWTKGFEPVFRINGKTAAPRIGNVIHCEKGFVAEAKAYDLDGNTLKKFENFDDGADHMKNFIDSVRAGKLVNENLHISHGYGAAVLSQMANLSYRLGKQLSNDEIKERLANDKAGQETYADFLANLEANQIDTNTEKCNAGPWLAFDAKTGKFTGEFAEEANKLAKDEYAPGFELPKIS